MKLIDASPELERLLARGEMPPPLHAPSEVRIESLMVPMRDGVRLATDLYLPPTLPAAVVAVRTPYGRSRDASGHVGAMIAFARRGYVAVSQDCRGTGESEPEYWDYYVHEEEDGYDLVSWICSQPWYGGFIGATGASYGGQTQWGMAAHPEMSAIIPAMSGLGVATSTVRLHMFMNAYALTIGKGDKQPIAADEMERHFEADTMAGGFFNAPITSDLLGEAIDALPGFDSARGEIPKDRLWATYCALTGAERAASIKKLRGTGQVTSVDIEALTDLFAVGHDAFSLPRANIFELARAIQALPLIRTGWYDWSLGDALATWSLLRGKGSPSIAEKARLLVTPYAHHVPGYRESDDIFSELFRSPTSLNQIGLSLSWFDAVRQDRLALWPRVIYYLMGANCWQAAEDWPVPGAREMVFYLHPLGRLSSDAPMPSAQDRYSYDPCDPTPTVGGSILSYRYPPGSVDVSTVQRRHDVLVYTSDVLTDDLDVVGPLRMVLHASSSAPDTDFSVRLSDVFPDGRAIQLQSGILRVRHRAANPMPIVPGQVYELEIDMWATANRFKAGHRLRIDISSADFPRFDRNANRAGAPGEPVIAEQTIYHDPEHPSRLVCQILRPSL